MQFHLDVIRGRGVPRSITVEASSADDAARQLVAQGYTALQVGRNAPNVLRDGRLSGSLRREPLNVAVFVEQLRDLLVAGLSLVESLQTLIRSTPVRDAEVIAQLTRRLSEGLRFSEALDSTRAFSPLLVALVQASEVTSDLPAALSRYLDHEKRASEVRHRMLSVAVYPLVLVAVGALVLIFLLFYVMPRFARVFDGMTGDLPWSARAMVAWSQWLGIYGGWFLALAVGAVGMLFIGAASRGLRARALQLVMDSPIMRDKLRIYYLARWFRATGMLAMGGIPLPQAVAMSNGLLPLVLQPGGVVVLQALHDGRSPTDAFVLATMTTPVAEQLTRAGEQTGDLGSVLTRIADFHDAQTARQLERAMRALEPVVMALVGLGVGVVVVLMYLPIFELASAIQ